MSKRLDKDREAILQPKRVNSAVARLRELGFEITFICDTRVEFIYKDNLIRFFPYSGWHTGKGIKDGRGWSKLERQINH